MNMVMGFGRRHPRSAIFYPCAGHRLAVRPDQHPAGLRLPAAAADARGRGDEHRAGLSRLAGDNALDPTGRPGALRWPWDGQQGRRTWRESLVGCLTGPQIRGSIALPERQIGRNGANSRADSSDPQSSPSCALRDLAWSTQAITFTAVHARTPAADRASGRMAPSCCIRAPPSTCVQISVTRPSSSGRSSCPRPRSSGRRRGSHEILLLGTGHDPAGGKVSRWR